MSPIVSLALLIQGQAGVLDAALESIDDDPPIHLNPEEKLGWLRAMEQMRSTLLSSV